MAKVKGKWSRSRPDSTFTGYGPKYDGERSTFVDHLRALIPVPAQAIINNVEIAKRGNKKRVMDAELIGHSAHDGRHYCSADNGHDEDT